MSRMKQRLRQALSQRHKKRIIDDSLVKSAVLVPIFHKHGEYYLLFTKRTEKVKDHKGQISFPGGAYQEGEDRTLIDTALRESAEEIGLTPDTVEVLGELDDTITVASNYIISPFVAFIPWPYQFKIYEEEVEEIIEVPIRALLDEGYLQQETSIINGKEQPTYDYHYQGKVIWGATARILNQFLGIAALIVGDK